MTFKKLAMALAKREGLKKQVNIAQISELLRCLGDLLNEPKADRYAIMHAIENHAMDKLVDAALKVFKPKRKVRGMK